MRFIQIFIPNAEDQDIDSICEEYIVLGRWHDSKQKDQIVLNLLVPTENAEALMDRFEDKFSHLKGFRIILFPVEAVLPREESGADEVGDLTDNLTGDSTQEDSGDQKADAAGRVSREELYADVTDNLGVNRVYLAMVILSSAVATIGLMRNDTAVLIGAMVIAPLLGPNVAMSLAVALGDLTLLRRASITNLVGIIVTAVIAILVGLIVPIEWESDAIMSRTTVDITDIILALAAGSAGTFAFTRGLSSAVIGVMVAVALMPPLVASGILFGAGRCGLAIGAFFLVMANLISVNLAGVATLLIQGVRPHKGEEAEQADYTSRMAIAIWVVLLIILGAILYFTNSF